MPTPILQTYINEINPFSLFRSLPVEEKSALLDGLKRGEIEARNKIIETHLRMVIYIAKKFIVVNKSEDFLMDIVQEGNLALCRKVNDKLPDKLVEGKGDITNYLGAVVDGEMKRAIAEKLRLIPISKTIYWEKVKLVKTQELFFAENGREASFDELAKSLHMSARKIQALIKVDSGNITSLNVMVEGIEGDEISLYAIVEDKTMPFLELIEKKILRARLNYLIENKLPIRQRQIIQMFYFEEKTIPEIANELNLSKSSVSTWKVEGLIILRKIMKNNVLMWRSSDNKNCADLPITK